MTTHEKEVEKIQLHVRIDRYLKDFLWQYAEERDTTASDVLRKYIRELYEKHVIREESGDVEQL